MLASVTEYRASGEGAYVCFGRALRTEDSGAGVSCAFFPAQSIVIYVRYVGRQACAWLFRCAPDGDAEIPGVSSPVCLLATAPTRGKVTRLKRVLDTLHRWEIAIDGLSDGFFLRLNSLLHSREFRVGQLKQILSHEKL